MITRNVRIALLLTLGVACAPLEASDLFKGGSPTGQPQAATPTQRVVRLVTNSERTAFGGGFGNGGGRQGRGTRGMRPGDTAGTGATNRAADVRVGHLIVTPPDGGPAVKLLVTEEVRKQLPGLALEAGDLMSITLKPTTPGGPADIVSAAAAYDGPKLLARPKTFIFQGAAEQKIGPQTFTGIKLTKFGDTRDAVIPNRPSFQGGKPQADEAVMSQVRALTAGDLVEVELTDGPNKTTPYVIELVKAQDPTLGEFVKLASLKDAANKPAQGVVLKVEGQERTYLLPAATGPGMRPATAATNAAMQSLAKKLKPGYGVQFTTRPVSGAPPTASTSETAAAATSTVPLVFRELTLDGDMLQTGEKSFKLVSTYLVINMSPGFRGDANIDYRPGSRNPDDALLDKGIVRALENDDEAEKLKITPEQSKQLEAARGDNGGQSGMIRPSDQERSAWSAAYTAYVNANTPTARDRIEQEMLFVANDLAGRWRTEIAAHYDKLRAILTPEQREGVIELARKKRTIKFD